MTRDGTPRRRWCAAAVAAAITVAGSGVGPAAAADRAVVTAVHKLSTAIAIVGVTARGAPPFAPAGPPARQVSLAPGDHEIAVSVTAAYACPSYETGMCTAGCFERVPLTVRAGGAYRLDATTGEGGCWIWIIDLGTGALAAGRRP